MNIFQFILNLYHYYIYIYIQFISALLLIRKTDIDILIGNHIRPIFPIKYKNSKKLNPTISIKYNVSDQIESIMGFKAGSGFQGQWIKCNSPCQETKHRKSYDHLNRYRKVLSKIQHSLLIKPSAKKTTKEHFFSLIKCIYDKPTVNIILNGFLGGSDGKASACNAEDPGSIPGSGRSPGEGNGNPLQYSGVLVNAYQSMHWTEKHGRL